jgi:signal transduction histidine kinase/CheY-like chemotaxis protein/Ca2+-binding EF-hand superfamily protein
MNGIEQMIMSSANQEAPTTSFASFNAEGRIISAGHDFNHLALNGSKAETLDAVLEAYLKQLDHFNQEVFTPNTASLKAASEKWSDETSPAIEARLANGEWRLLSRYLTPDGGSVLLSVNINKQKWESEFSEFMLQNSPLPVWANDAETGDLLYANAATHTLYKKATDNDSKIGLKKFFAKNNEDPSFRTLMKTGYDDNYTFVTKNAGGEELWFNGAARLLRSGTKDIIVTTTQDVTDKKRREEELNKAKEILSDAIESLSEGFALYDEDGTLVMLNDKYREMNQGVADLLEPGLNWEILVRESARRGIYADAIGRENKWVNERLESGTEFIQNFELWHADGSCYTVSVHPTKLGGFVVTRMDITAEKQADEMRREADVLLHKVLEACPANVLMARIGDGKIIYRSPAARDLFGNTESTKDHYVYPEDNADYLTDLLPTGRIDDFETLCIRPDGTHFPAAISAQIIDYRGEDVIVSNTIDLTEQLQARQEISFAAKRLTDAIESLDEGFALFDSEHKLVIYNNLYLDSNKPLKDVIKPDTRFDEILYAEANLDRKKDIDVFIQAYEDSKISGYVRAERRDIMEEDGRTFSTSINPTSEGGFVVTRLDVTRQREMEAERRAADEVVRHVLEACPVPLQMVKAKDGELLFRSPETISLLGDPPSSRSYFVDLDAFDAYRSELQKKKFVNDYRIELYNAKGEPFWAAISCRLIDFRGEQVVVANTRDLTDELALQDELARQREILFQSEKMSALGELLAGVAHELNNPLSIIVGHSLMMQEEVTNPETGRRVDIISNAAQRCAKIIKTFLAMARQKPAEMQDIDMNLVIASALDVTDFASGKGNLKLERDLMKNLPMVNADADQITQVVVNLVINAEQAISASGKPGKVTIKTDYDTSSSEVVIRVADDGPGIPDTISARIFEPFFTTKEIGQGTGIGLAFCHRILESHGGSITVKSKERIGTEFTLRLPANSGVVSTLETSPEISRTASTCNILVVDDEGEVAELMQEILVKEGFDVDTAHNGSAALKKISSKSYGLILSDLNMPILDGKGLFERIKSDYPELADRIGFITGDTMSEDAQLFLKQVKRPKMEKPINPRELRNLVYDMLEEIGEPVGKNDN